MRTTHDSDVSGLSVSTRKSVYVKERFSILIICNFLSYMLLFVICLYYMLCHAPVTYYIYTAIVEMLSFEIDHFNSIETLWRHQMETFSALLAICAGNSPVTGEFPTQRPVTRSFDVFYDLRLNKRLSKQSWGWWFDTPSCPLWRHCNEFGESKFNHDTVCSRYNTAIFSKILINDSP